MNIRDCQYIIAVDELKSFAKAAKKCFISQPALSQQIKKVEDQLDVEIFERYKKNIITTTKGLEIVKIAKEIVASFQKLKHVAKNEEHIKLALIPTICPYLLPRIVQDLNTALPSTKFFFLEEKTDNLIEKLKNGAIDCGIIAYFDNLIESNMTYQKLYDEEFMLTVPLGSSIAKDDLPQIISERKLILLEEGNCISDNIKDICELQTKDSFNDFYATNIETVKSMIRSGNGIGLLPKLSISDHDRQTLKIIPMGKDKTREIGLVWRKNAQIETLITSLTKVTSGIG